MSKAASLRDEQSRQVADDVFPRPGDNRGADQRRSTGALRQQL